MKPCVVRGECLPPRFSRLLYMSLQVSQVFSPLFFGGGGGVQLAVDLPPCPMPSLTPRGLSRLVSPRSSPTAKPGKGSSPQAASKGKDAAASPSDVDAEPKAVAPSTPSSPEPSLPSSPDAAGSSLPPPAAASVADAPALSPAPDAGMQELGQYWHVLALSCTAYVLLQAGNAFVPAITMVATSEDLGMSISTFGALRLHAIDA